MRQKYDHDQIRSWYYDENVSGAEIARRLSTSERYVRLLLRRIREREGLALKPKGRRPCSPSA